MKLDKSKISRSYEKNLESGFKNSYKSPIQVIIETKAAEINEKKINRLLEVVTSYDIKIDKDELMQIISDDKYRYMQGFNDAVKQLEQKGYRTAHACWHMKLTKADSEYTQDVESIYCGVCGKHCDYKSNFCPHCGAKMDKEV